MLADKISGDSTKPSFAFAFVTGRASVTSSLAARLLQKVVRCIPVSTHPQEEEPIQGIYRSAEYAQDNIPPVAGIRISLRPLTLRSRDGNLHVDPSASLARRRGSL